MKPKIHAYTKQGTYFQVPLCALAYGRSESERLDAIIDFGCRHAGRAEWRRMTEAERRAWLIATRQSHKHPADLNFSDADDIAIALGAEITRVTIPNIVSLKRRLQPFDQFLSQYHAEHGRDPSVRIKDTYVFEARDGRGISYRELSVLAAIYSIVGHRREPVRITRESIRRRALGYRSASVFKQAFPGRSDRAVPLTEWKLRATVEALRNRRLLQRHTFRRRLTFYGVGITKKGFEMALHERLTCPASHGLLEKLDAQGFDARVLNTRATLSGLPLPYPEVGGKWVPPWEDPAVAETPFLAPSDL